MALKKHYDEVLSQTTLRQLLQDDERNAALRFKILDKIYMDFSHTKIDKTGLDLLLKAAGDQKVSEAIQAMFNGEEINSTEKR